VLYASSILTLSEAAARLVAHARAERDDSARWQAVADALVAEKNPLGEYIALSLQIRAGDFSGKKRHNAVAASWRKRFAPWAKIFSWWNIGLVLTMRELESVFAHIDDLRAIGLPLVLEITRGSNAPDICMFDEAFTRMAWMRKDTTVENASWGPGLDEHVYHWRDVVVWRLSDRAELYRRGGIEADWIAVELRGDAAYAIGAKPGNELVAGGLMVDETTFEEAIATPGRSSH
jgi:hypothetical protein